MARFVLNQTIETAEPTIAVDAGLPPGRHRFQLVVIDDAGRRSRPVEAIVEIQREIVPPPPVIRTEPRSDPVPPRRKRSRKPGRPPAKKPRRPRRKE
jgi:hypothetical protein